VTAGLLGAIAAVIWGSADFIARFTGRALGYDSALLGMLIAGAIGLTLWIWLGAEPVHWHATGWWLIAASGLAVMVGSLFLYNCLARGPVTIVAPIVGSYPALIVVLLLILGARPSVMQWAGMAGCLAGVVIVSRSAGGFETSAGYTRHDLRITVALALVAALCFAVALAAGQAASATFGASTTSWLTRLTSLGLLLLLFLGRRRMPRLPLRWWPALAAQGTLDSGAYVFVFAATSGEGAAIAAVTSSGFSAVTVILARVILREQMSLAQWFGTALIVAAVAVLSAP